MKIDLTPALVLITAFHVLDLLHSDSAAIVLDQSAMYVVILSLLATIRPTCSTSVSIIVH